MKIINKTLKMLTPQRGKFSLATEDWSFSLHYILRVLYESEVKELDRKE